MTGQDPLFLPEYPASALLVCPACLRRCLRLRIPAVVAVFLAESEAVLDLVQQRGAESQIIKGTQKPGEDPRAG